MDSNCLPRIVNLLNDDAVLGFAIPVLFNICVDYGRAHFDWFIIQYTNLLPQNQLKWLLIKRVSTQNSSASSLVQD